MKQRILMILWIASLLISLVGCGEVEVPATTSATEASTTTTVTTEEPVSEDDVTEAVSTEEPTESLNLSTTGGVVLVGTVNRDESGWFLVPEQPLNVEFHYFLDNPCYFEGLERIDLFDSTTDGIEKLDYLGDKVTIEGVFSFYRDDFEQLYLLPYTIFFGKTVESSYAAPDLQPPDRTANRYDPSIPLPERMHSVVQDGRFVYNPYMLSEETLEMMGNDFAAFYCEFVDAFLNYKPSCPCPDEQFAQILSTIIYYEFPAYEFCAALFDFSQHYNSAEQTVSISYLYDEATHLQKVRDFMDAADAFLAGTSPEQSQAELAKTIYHAICTRMTYDYSALEILERKRSFYAYMENTGVCVTFANIYNQLLTQVGIRATTADCLYTLDMGHVWTLATIDGEKYFFDPTFELNYDAGSGYRFFGQTYAQRTANDFGKYGLYAGRYYSSPIDETMISATPLEG